MQVDAFLLADAVSTPGDGKFYVHGGGLSRFVVPMLPFPLVVALFIRFEVDEADIAKTHHLRVVVYGPVGPNIPPLDIIAAPPDDPPPLLPGEQRFMQVGLNLPLGIVRTGLYRIELEVDGELVRSLRVPLILADEAEE